MSKKNLKKLKIKNYFNIIQIKNLNIHGGWVLPNDVMHACPIGHQRRVGS